MPTSKEVLALRWANKTEEEKKLQREKDAEKMRKYRAKNGRKKRCEMDSDELQRQRLMDKINKKQKRDNMTEEQKEASRAKDRARKAKKSSKSKGKEDNIRDGKNKSSSLVFELEKFENRKMKQLLNNCRTQQRLRTRRTKEEEEKIQVEKVIQMRQKRSKLSEEGQMLARLEAKDGMKEHREHGYIREYKQRKRREWYNPNLWKLEPHALSKYFEKKKQQETEQDRKEEKKRKNRNRVERHRLKIKKMLQDPVIIENYGEKSEYELLRERNILEREALMKKSGLFD